MAHAMVPDEVDPLVKLQRQMDEAWLSDLDLIRKFSEEEKQAEEDHRLAMELAGLSADDIPFEQRQLAILVKDFDDDQPEAEDSDFPNNPVPDQRSDPGNHLINCKKPGYNLPKK